MAIFATPTLVSTTNDSLIKSVGTIGTVSTGITSTVNVAAQAIDMASMKMDVIHSGVKDATILDKEEQRDIVIMDRAARQLKRLEDHARLLGQTIDSTHTYNSLITKYTALLNPETTVTPT
mgnify:FL=1